MSDRSVPRPHAILSPCLTCWLTPPPALLLSGWYVPRTKSRDGGRKRSRGEVLQEVTGGRGGERLCPSTCAVWPVVLFHSGILKISSSCKLLVKGQQCITPQNTLMNCVNNITYTIEADLNLYSNSSHPPHCITTQCGSSQCNTLGKVEIESPKYNHNLPSAERPTQPNTSN